MTKRTSRAIPVMVAGALGFSGAIAAAAEPTAQELRQQIEALQTKVEQLETTRQQSPSQSEVDATVASVLTDAERRSQLLFQDGAMTGGWEKGKFVLRSADGNYSLNPNLQLQVRHVTNYRDGADGDDEDIQNGFEIRRAKFAFNGNVVNPDWTYMFQWESSRSGGAVSLQDAWVRWQYSDDMAFKLGQFKDILFHEETTSSKRQLAVDRSLMNELLAGGQTDYVQGVSLTYQASDQLRAEVVLHDGYNSDNTPFSEAGGTSSLGVTPTNWGVSGRVEYFVNGAGSKAYDDFTAMNNAEDLLVIGAGADWSQSGNDDVLFLTADAQWENTAGLGVYVAGVGVLREIDDIAPGEDDAFDTGLVAQVGYMVNEDWEVFGRGDVTLLDEDVLGADEEDTYTELTAGVNYYVNGHAAKFTVDLTYLPDGSPSSETGIGVLAGEEDQFVVRGQFQLLL